MARNKDHMVDMLGEALRMISGNIRKVSVPMLFEEKDRIEEFAKKQKTTAPEMVMDMVNFYWDDYVKRHSPKNRRKRKVA